MQFPNVDDIIIIKPKKDGSTYFAPIFLEKKKNVFQLELFDIHCVRQKSGSVFFKNKVLMQYIADLCEHIVEVVKANCGDWFNSNMNVDLIEEYFSNPMKYDKEYGYVLKIDTDVHFEVSDRYNVSLEVKGLRFLKQKFSLEWCITSSEKSGDLEFIMEDVSDISEEDVAEPIPDDMENLKNAYIAKIDTMLEEISLQQDALSVQMRSLESLKSDVQSERPNFIDIEMKLETFSSSQ